MSRHIQHGIDAARPAPHRPIPDRILWLDWTSGRGLDWDGRSVEPIMDSRRKYVRLVDLLETARHHHADRIMLCGKEPSGWSWLVPAPSMGSGPEAMQKFLPGWVDTGSYLERPARGRFQHVETAQKVQVMLASEWIPGGCDPVRGLWTFNRVTEVVAEAIHRDWGLMRTPSATGLNIWKLTAAPSYDMAPMDPTIGALIQHTEPQHRFESFLATDRCGCGDCIPLIDSAEIEGFCYADGRFMFHVVPKPLGAAPAYMMSGDEAEQLYRQDPYHPARYRVQVTMDEFWMGPGLFPVKHDNPELGWHYPNRGGCTFETWVDSHELTKGLASLGVERLEFLEGIRLTKTNSMEPFVGAIDRMLKLTEQLKEGGQDVSPMGKAAVASVIKAMYRSTIGAMSRRARLTSHFTADADQVPADSIDLERVDNGWRYKTRAATNPRDWETWHPEIAARVWGASRARMLETPVAKSLLDRDAIIGADGKRKTRTYGLLQIDPEQLIGIQGDAIYTTRPMEWTLPEDLGGGDDGKDGRIRIKGYLPGPLPTPQSTSERQVLSNKAEAEGWQGKI